MTKSYNVSIAGMVDHLKSILDKKEVDSSLLSDNNEIITEKDKNKTISVKRYKKNNTLYYVRSCVV